MEGILDALTHIPVIETAIGMFFVYLLLSLLVSVIQEFIAKLSNRREKVLEDAIIELIGSEAADELYKHPLIKALYVNGKKPSYIPSKSFAIALLEVFKASNSESEDAVDEIRDKVKQLDNSLVRTALLVALKATEGSVETALDNIGTWFDNAMNSVSAWYKTHSQFVTFAVAVVLVISFNADTIALTKQLSGNPALRAELILQAQMEQADVVPENRSNEMDSSDTFNRLLEETKLQFGWWDEEGGWVVPNTAGGVVVKLLGLLITIFMISLGAPFWYDLLSKILRYRKPKAD